MLLSIFFHYFVLVPIYAHATPKYCISKFFILLHTSDLHRETYNLLLISVRCGVLYVCKTWLLTLREEHRLRVFENRVLRRIFGLKRDEVSREWRKLHNEHNDLCTSPNIVRVIKIENEMGWACSTHGGYERRLQDFGGET